MFPIFRKKMRSIRGQLYLLEKSAINAHETNYFNRKRQTTLNQELNSSPTAGVFFSNIQTCSFQTTMHTQPCTFFSNVKCKNLPAVSNFLHLPRKIWSSFSLSSKAACISAFTFAIASVALRIKVKNN